MSLVTLADVRALVKTPLTDAQLQDVIDREEAEVTRLIGAPYAADLELAEDVYARGEANLYLRRPIETVIALMDEDGNIYTEGTDYYVWAAEGRIQRLPVGARWWGRFTVTYTPADDTARRKAVIIELVRLTLERTAMRSESVGGEYSYNAPDWDVQRARLLRSLWPLEV